MRPVLLSIGPYDVLLSPFITLLAALATFFYLRAHARTLGLSQEGLWELALVLLVSVFLGGFLAEFLFYDGGPSANLSFLLTRRVPRGGSLYGAFWGVVLAAFLYCRRRGLDFRRLADVLGGMSPLALVIKRLGCFAQGCCYGRPTSLPWGVVFRDPRAHVSKALLGVPLHPTQLYEAAAGAALFAVVHFGALRGVREGRLAPGAAFCVSTALYALLRFALEPLRGAPPGPGVLDLPGLDTTRVFALASLATAVLLYRRWSRHAA